MKNHPASILAVFTQSNRPREAVRLAPRVLAHVTMPTSSVPVPVTPGVKPHSPSIIRNTDLPSGGGIKGERNY